MAALCCSPGLAAAALTGNLDTVQLALQASGCKALAALQSNAFRLACAMENELLWNGHLKYSSQQHADMHTASFAHFVVSYN